MAIRPQQINLDLRCLDPRCATLLPADAEICDECGGTALGALNECAAVLLGGAAERPVAFGLVQEHANLVGRATPGLEVDLSRLPGSDSVHRHHARIDFQQGEWVVTHLGRNPIVVSRAEGTLVVQPGTAAALRSGDWLQIGRIRFRFIVGPGRGPAQG